jgi:deoxyribonuclease V
VIAAFDVHYFADGRASAAAVVFRSYADSEPAKEYVEETARVLPYVPGQFYRRELPCILTLLEHIHESPGEMIIDGYVMLGDLPGLGRHLFDSLSGRIPIIGVAKSKHENAPAIEVFRGISKKPLYVTSAGIDPREAAERIRLMDGPHRVPTLLARVDLLARGEPRRPGPPFA